MVRLRLYNLPDNSLGCYLYTDQDCLHAERRQWSTDAESCPDGQNGAADLLIGSSPYDIKSRRSLRVLARRGIMGLP